MKIFSFAGFHRRAEKKTTSFRSLILAMPHSFCPLTNKGSRKYVARNDKKQHLKVCIILLDYV